MPVIADADGRDDRDHARSADRIKQATVDMAWLPHETQVHDTLDIAIRISLRAPDLGGGDKTAVLSGNTDGTSARLTDPAYPFLVHGTGYHRFRHTLGFAISHAQNVFTLRFNVKLLQHPTNLRPAATHDDQADRKSVLEGKSRSGSEVHDGSPI